MLALQPWLLACLQLACLGQRELVSGYFRQQRKSLEDIDWSYSGALNQTNWGKKYPACNGAKQSPVNIDEDLTQVNVNLKELTFQDWEKETSEDTLIYNTGKTVEIKLTNEYFVTGGGLEGVFKASKITFHWGKCNISHDGSEHSIEGQKYPLEMQIYCYDPNRFEDIDKAIEGNGKLRVLSILFEVGLEDNVDYNSIIDGVASVSRFGKKSELEPFVLLNLLPNSTNKYYTYNGSLSTPPCSETVEWIIFKDPVNISENQLTVFCDVLTMQQSGYVMLMDYLQNNFREQQLKFSGQVFSSYTGQEEIHEAVCSLEPENVQADPKNYTSLLVTWERPRVVYDTMIERFAVFYQQLEGEDQKKHEYLTDGYQDLGAILNNLLPNTSYVLQIVAICANGLYGKYSDQVIVDMPLDDPEIDFPGMPEDYEEEDELEEARAGMGEEAAVISSADSVTNQIRKKEFQFTTSSYSQERMSTKLNEAGTHRYLTKEEDSHGNNDQSKTIFHPTSQPITEVSKKEEDDSVESQTATAALFPPNSSSKGNEEEYAHVISDTAIRASAADDTEDDIEVSAFKPDPDTDNAWSSVHTTSPPWLVTVETAQESIFSSGSPDKIRDDLSQNYIKILSEDVTPPSTEDFADKVLAANGNLWYHNGTNATSDPLDSKQLFHISSPNPTTVPYPGGPLVSQDSSAVDIELPHSSTFAFSPTELSSYSDASNSEEHGSASSANEVLSQTTQPVYNGEIPLQPSYSSEVFPLVTPLLSDAEMLNTFPAASSSDVTLHATPVFPSVGVSFESTLSSYGDVPLLPFSSASSSSKVFHHLYMVSQTFPQAIPAVENDKVSLHVPLTLAEGGILMQSSLPQFSDVTSHQTVGAASETLIFGHDRTHLLSQVEPSSSGLNMHALSTVSELTYALSSNVGSLETVAASYYPSEFVHESVGTFHQGPLFSSYSNVLMHKPSAISQADTLLQPTSSLSSEMDWSEAYSGSESLLPGTDILSMLKASSRDPSGDLISSTRGFTGDIEMPPKNGVIEGYDKELQISSFSEMASLAEIEMTELATVSDDEITNQDATLQEVLITVSSAKGVLPVSVAFPATKVFDDDASKLSESHIPIQPLHVTMPASDDTLLKPLLSAVSQPASLTPASSKILHPSTQQYFYEASATLSNNTLLQTSFQSSDDGPQLRSSVTDHSDPILTEKNKSPNNGSSVFDQILNQMALDSSGNKKILHSTSAPSAVNTSYTTSSLTNLQGSLTVAYINDEYSLPRLLNSEEIHQDAPSLYTSDVSNQSTRVENKGAFSFKVVNTMAIPILQTDTLPNTAATANSHSLPNVSEQDVFPTLSASTNIVDSTVPVPEIISDSVQHTFTSTPDMHISATADSSSTKGSKILKTLLFPTKVTTELSTTATSVTDLWSSIVDEDYDEYDSGLPVNNCHTCLSHRETQEELDEPDTQANSINNQYSLITNSHFETSEEKEKKTVTALSHHTVTNEMDQLKYTSVPAVASNTKTKKHSNPTVLNNQIQTVRGPLKKTPESKSWAVFTSDEESGSGQSTSDSINDNETSTDFSFSDVNDRDSDGVVGAGNSGLISGSQQSSVASSSSGHSSVFNISEAEASNSSLQSRIGLPEQKTVIPLVVVSALTFICLVVLVGILIYWRKCFQTAHFYLEDNTSPRVISTPPAPVFPVSDDVGAIPTKHFPKHVADLHATNGFAEEFETLKEFYQEIQNCTVDMGITSDSSNHPDNKNKNRYINIVAYDHSRVKLAQLSDKDGKPTDYINANYVDGYNRPKAYIAAQGPLKSTAEDFWRMIWEHNVEVIVMITNLVEKGRRKCDQYWPADGSEEYGNFLVTQKSIHVLAYYTVRNFTIRNTKVKKGSQKGRPSGRVVSQYHYTQWPDMGVPEYTLPVLTFVRKVSYAKRHAVGPVVVHCSAGVGRTGTYIVLDSMLQQIQHEGTVNVFGFLKHIRTQRNYLVQTEEQYVFIHDALVEAILSKETEVPENHIHAYVNSLLIPGPMGKTRLEKQFKLLSQSNIQQCDYSTALKQCNREKNRTSSIIPVERSRVGISSLSGEGTDYINASYIMGYYQSNEFIVTQHPLLHTIKDFWRMIWDHNAQIIVMLPDSQNMAEDEFVYWPNKEDPINCESFKVSLISEEHKCLSNEEKLIIQDFILEATQDDYVLEVRHFQCPKWPNPDSPISKTFELINVIKEETSNRDGPMIVHDEHGGVTAGTFCALTTLMHQLENENCVDVYHVAKMINLMRPGVFTDIDHYQFLYKTILSLVSSRQEENPSVSIDSNGSALPDGNAAESLESLV
ncbi:LOW QUALITY PROTEIN: receptor-type tyrosine-protein phosphatase zeta [Sceloporus undulatus]|uniref:LOW QUALITY PROTEIN: receptor-type tyrosine-protein phosphatase zeta n=1 Tax=Sceloporus undulatus TaxID=8520 RepID=UPI001C4C3A55|nr:LOW QUALITY PROTEIN: receptor-type tyrosine-protein phosphatase zeta [Sceloporus undulatus]